MTDNEIKKALECCIKSSHFGECFENQCPLVSEKGCKVGKETLYPYTLDLINRLKAENKSQSIMIKMLKGSIEDYKNSYINQKAEIERLKESLNIELENFATEYDNKIKAEAYKECIEKVKEEINKHSYGVLHKIVINYKLDNLLKEKVDEDNA